MHRIIQIISVISCKWSGLTRLIYFKPLGRITKSLTLCLAWSNWPKAPKKFKNENACVSDLPRINGSKRKFHLTTLTLMHLDLHTLGLWPPINDLYLDTWTPFLIVTFELGALELRSWHLNLTLTLTLVTLNWPLYPTDNKQKNVISMFDLDLWPMTLTFKLILARVKVKIQAKNQGRRSNGLAIEGQRDKHTYTHGTDNITSSGSTC